MKKQRKRKIIFLKSFVSLLSLFLIIHLLFILSILLILIILQKRKSGEIGRTEPTIFNHKFYQFNPNSNISSFGIQSSYRDISNKYLSYVDNNGNYILVSHFEENEYKCTGSCFCDERKRRFLSSIPAINGMIYLVAAVSSAVAYKYAGEHFLDECRNSISEYCTLDHLHSEVDDCEIIHVDFEKGEKVRDNLGRKYLCRGNCEVREYKERHKNPDGTVNMDGLKLQKAASEFGCSDLRLETIEVLDNERGEDTLEIEDPLILALALFTVDTLSEFCLQNSRTKVTVGFSREKEYRYPIVEQTSLCVGYTKEVNPTVFCREHF